MLSREQMTRSPISPASTSGQGNQGCHLLLWFRGEQQRGRSACGLAALQLEERDTAFSIVLFVFLAEVELLLPKRFLFLGYPLSGPSATEGRILFFCDVGSSELETFGASCVKYMEMIKKKKTQMTHCHVAPQALCYLNLQIIDLHAMGFPSFGLLLRIDPFSQS